MALPPLEPLFAHLESLRDAEDPFHPSWDGRWRAVDAWLRAAFPAEGATADEVHQRTILSVARSVGSMTAATPKQAAKWISTIRRRKRIDLARAAARDPVAGGLSRRDASEGDAPDAIAALPAPDAPLPEPAVDRLLARVLEEIDADLAKREPNAMKRELRRTQATACLLRLVRQRSAPEIVDALGVREPVSHARLYKWVERGRATVLRGLNAWDARMDQDEREALGPALHTLREIVTARRRDAGVARGSRGGPEASPDARRSSE